MTTKAKRVLIFGIILNVVFLSLYGGLFFIIKKKNDTAVSLQVDIKLQEIKKERLESARQVVEAVEADAKKISSFGVFTDEEHVRFIASLEELGRGAGARVEVKNPRFENGSSKEKDYFAMDVIALGNFKSVMRLLSLFEALPMDLEIVKISFAVEAEAKSLETGDAKGDKVQTQSVAQPTWKADIALRVLKFKN